MVAGANDADHFIASLFHPPRDREDRSHADPAAYTNNGSLFFLNMGRIPQGSDEIQDAFPFGEASESFGSRANFLKYDGDGSCRSVKISDGEGNPLSLFIHPQNDKLSRLSFAGHHRCFHNHLLHTRRQSLFRDNLIHEHPSCR